MSHTFLAHACPSALSRTTPPCLTEDVYLTLQLRQKDIWSALHTGNKELRATISSGTSDGNIMHSVRLGGLQVLPPKEANSRVGRQALRCTYIQAGKFKKKSEALLSVMKNVVGSFRWPVHNEVVIQVSGDFPLSGAVGDE
ncbi:hypothetical protein BKA83DRAFT_4128228 [Pisolithus microcarpus]|nr:hypothetical protein BKA83DRAFT_4128228 [Pisolithus microcarpus]